MGTEEIILSVTRLSLGAVATLLAILLWSLTRDTAWLLIIAGTILKYGELLYSTFETFGLFPSDVMLIPGYLGVDIILKNLPPPCYIAAFAVMIRRNKLGR